MNALETAALASAQLVAAAAPIAWAETVAHMKTHGETHGLHRGFQDRLADITRIMSEQVAKTARGR